VRVRLRRVVMIMVIEILTTRQSLLAAFPTSTWCPLHLVVMVRTAIISGANDAAAAAAAAAVTVAVTVAFAVAIVALTRRFVPP